MTDPVRRRSRRVAQSLRIAILGLVLPAASAAHAIAPHYVLTDVTPSTSIYGIAYGINAKGQVTGQYRGDADDFYAFLWSPASPNAPTGSFVDLGDFVGGMQQSAGWAINDFGQVVGTGNVAAGERAFLWQPDAPNGSTGTMTELAQLPDGQNRNQAYDINSFGQIVGYSGNRAFLWQPNAANGSTGSLHDLGDLPDGGDFSQAYGVNDYGQVVGWSNAPGGTFAFLWQPSDPGSTSGQMHQMARLPDAASVARGEAINGSGQIVGMSDAGYLSTHPTLWAPATPNAITFALTDLDPTIHLRAGEHIARDINAAGDIVGTSIWNAGLDQFQLRSLLHPDVAESLNFFTLHGINDAGQIVGLGIINGHERAILLTPVPEPKTALLMLAVLGWSLGTRRLAALA